MRVNLDHNWKLRYENGVVFDNISLPHQFPITEQSYPNPLCFSGVYERKLPELKGLSKKHVLLKFHGIDFFSKVYVNQKLVSSHENGYDLFEIQIDDYLNFDGQDLLQIFVSDLDITKNPRTVMGKQDWYGNACGIIQKVELWVMDKVFIKSARFFPLPDLKTIECKVEFSDDKEHEFSLSVTDPLGVVTFNEKIHRSEFNFAVENPRLWSLESPQLYTAIIDFNDGDSKDRYQTRFGIRVIKTDRDRILLNGDPLYLFGALDQNFYPITHYTLPKKNDLFSELLKAKEMGLNLLRFHVKVPDDLYLELADELGLLVWIDLPYARQLDKKSEGYLEDLLENLLKRHANHPSFVILSLINESWGIDLSNKQTREWLKNFYERAKTIDSTRLYVDNSACVGNFHVQSDIDDFHFYNSFPYHNEQWDEKIKIFATNEFKSFLETKTKLPKVVSEFGVWGLSDPKDWEGNWMNFPVMVMGNIFPQSAPATAISKVCNFHNLDDFVYQAQLHQFLGLKYQIESIRLRPEISGYVITEFSDIAWEANGLLDYNRMPKTFYSKLKFLNGEILTIVRNHRSILQKGEIYNAEIYVANNSKRDLSARLIVRTDREVLREIRIFSKKWTVSKITDLSLELKQDTQNIFLEIFEDGKLISRNFYPVVVVEPSPLPEEIIWVRDEKLDETDLVSISQSQKLYGFLDLSGDWISNITVFNTKRNKNIAALLWSLGEISSEYILLKKQDLELSSENSLISKIIGWGYGIGSILYVKENSSGKKIYTTLKDSALSRLVISYIMY